MKMKPGAYDLSASQSFSDDAMYPPITPKAFANVPLIISIRGNKLSRSAIPPPVLPYMPTACTSSRYVNAPNSSAKSHIELIGAKSPSMEYIDSKAMSLGAFTSSSAKSCRKCSTSLWWKILFSPPLRLIPSIIEA